MSTYKTWVNFHTRLSSGVTFFFLLFWILVPAIDGLAAQERVDIPAVGYSASREGLIYDLKHPDAFRRKQAVELIGRNRILEALDPVLAVASDPEVEVRRAVVVAFQGLLDVRAGKTLADMLHDTDTMVRQKAIRALIDTYLGQNASSLGTAVKKVGSIFNPRVDTNNDIIEPDLIIPSEVISALADCLKDANNGIRRDAAQALGILRGDKAVPDMVAALKAESDKNVIKEIIRSFSKIGNATPGNELLHFTQFNDTSIEEEAIMALGILKVEGAVERLTRIYKSGSAERRRILGIIPASRSDLLNVRALQALSQIGSSQSKEVFFEVLTHADPGYRQAGAEGLARLKAVDNTQDVLAARQKETKDNPRMAQDFALFRFGKGEFLDELVAGMDGGNEFAYSYLMELKDGEVNSLYRFLDHESPKIRARMAEILGHIGNESTLAKLEPLTNDRDSQVLAAAVKAQRRLQGKYSK